MAKWELIYYLEEGATNEHRYFNTIKEAEAYAEAEGYQMEDYSIKWTILKIAIFTGSKINKLLNPRFVI